MKRMGILFLLFLSSIIILLTGCDFREVLDDYPVSGVRIKLNWNGVTEKLPEGMRVIFYPKSAEGRKVDKYISTIGGEVPVPPGHYSVVIYNYNTECIEICGESSYETIEAFALPCSEMNLPEEMVWAPDPLYVVALDEIKIEKSDIETQLEFKPENVVKRYTFEIKVGGLKNVAKVICDVKGLDGSFFMGLNSCRTSKLPVYVEMQKGDGILKGVFSSFIMAKRDYSCSKATRADAEVMMTLKLVKVDNSIQEVKVDITKVVVPPDPPVGGEEPQAPDAGVKIEIPLEEDIVVDDVPGVDGGGIGGDVGGWGDETEVEL